MLPRVYVRVRHLYRWRDVPAALCVSMGSPLASISRTQARGMEDVKAGISQMHLSEDLGGKGPHTSQEKQYTSSEVHPKIYRGQYSSFNASRSAKMRSPMVLERIDQICFAAPQQWALQFEQKIDRHGAGKQGEGAIK